MKWVKEYKIIILITSIIQITVLTFRIVPVEEIFRLIIPIFQFARLSVDYYTRGIKKTSSDVAFCIFSIAFIALV